jgi:hypothetical protein
MSKSQQACSDDEFIALWRTFKSGTRVAEHLGIGVRPVLTRRRHVEKRYGIFLDTDSPLNDAPGPGGFRAIEPNIRGNVIVFSDAHYWPGKPSIAHRALVSICKQLQPTMVVANGDMLDGARLCRQDPIGWSKSKAPTIKQETEALQERMHEVVMAAGKKCKRRRTIGNHDIRLERMLAMKAPDLEGMPYTKLADFLPEWEESWSIMVNGHTMIKHRYHNGIHSTWNNTLKAGRNIFTGHLHRLQATILSDYSGPRWGVDTGTLADVTHENPAFEYDEDSPRNWASGFAVATFGDDGRLLHPEFCVVLDGVAYFRGKRV